MGSVSKQDRERALKAVAFWCISQVQGIELEQNIVESLGFGSVEALKTQLGNWGVPSWVTHGGDEDAEGPRTSKPAAHKRQARIAYERSIRQAEKFGHSDMAEDLRLALDGLGN
jgi:hypothetical protein